jgi:hypothetical protein
MYKWQLDMRNINTTISEFSLLGDAGLRSQFLFIRNSSFVVSRPLIVTLLGLLRYKARTFEILLIRICVRKIALIDDRKMGDNPSSSGETRLSLGPLNAQQFYAELSKKVILYPNELDQV